MIGDICKTKQYGIGFKNTALLHGLHEFQSGSLILPGYVTLGNFFNYSRFQFYYFNVELRIVSLYRTVGKIKQCMNSV
jgi:hypothetical protein